MADRKLLVIIASNHDADALIRRLVERGYRATRASSTGGILRHGSTAVLSAVDDNDVEELMAIVRSERAARGELVPGRGLSSLNGVVSRSRHRGRRGAEGVFVIPCERVETV